MRCQSACNRHALTLAARQTRRVAIRIGSGKVNGLKELRYLTDLAAAHAQGLGKGRADASGRIEGRVGILEDDANRRRSPGAGATRSSLDAVDTHAARIDLFQSNDQTRERCLSRTRFADNAH